MHNFYLEKMLEMLTGAYNRTDLVQVQKEQAPQSNLGKLLFLFTEGLTHVHTNLDMIRNWGLSEARGAVLDRYGENFGVQREYTDDDFYRLMIEVKMLSQLSGGDIDTIIRAAAILFDVEESRVELREIFPAKIWILVNELDLDEIHLKTAPLAAQMLKRIKAASVGNRVFLKNRYAAAFKLRTGVAEHISNHYGLAPVPLLPAKAPILCHIGTAGLQQERSTIQPHTDPKRQTNTSPAFHVHSVMFEHTGLQIKPKNQRADRNHLIVAPMLFEHQSLMIRPIANP